MATKPKGATPKRRPRELPEFISKVEISDTLRCSVETVGDWVESGHFPPPALYPGPERRISLWRLDHFRAYLDSGQWPAEAYGRQGG